MLIAQAFVLRYILLFFRIAYVAIIAIDIFFAVGKLFQESCRVAILQQLQVSMFRAVNDKRMFAEELTCQIVGLQFFEDYILTNPRFRQFLDVLLRRAGIDSKRQLSHETEFVDARVVQDCRKLNVWVAQLTPFDQRVFVFFLLFCGRFPLFFCSFKSSAISDT